MKVHYGLEHPINIERSVVTTGTFDGVHVGHQVILKRIGQLAREIDGESVLITFHPHPRKVLYPDTLGRDLKLIYSQREKIALLETTGLDHLVIIPFTTEFAHTPSEVFIRDILVKKLRISKSVVGFNHFFGFNKEGNYEQLSVMGKELGFEVEEIPEQDIQNETVSSTRIRKAIEEGNIQRANAYLNHICMMMGHLQKATEDVIPVTGHEVWVIPAEETEKLLPPEGVYAIRISQDTINIKAIGIRSRVQATAHSMIVIPFETVPSVKRTDSRVYFYRQLSKAFPMELPAIKSFIAEKIQEANELIY